MCYSLSLLPAILQGNTDASVSCARRQIQITLTGLLRDTLKDILSGYWEMGRVWIVLVASALREKIGRDHAEVRVDEDGVTVSFFGGVLQREGD
ncbi:hypothetical protein AG0111_0g8655 [Alternaria gaisen]|uniref:Uncharacterized protein n=1 Tax=Alternaria gaisen TaxID=167740 RepID=A0ACB6FG55_9PLEO|nr:hypothetical protein AG0111_0g8655 [Alternaria gaisen]